MDEWITIYWQSCSNFRIFINNANNKKIALFYPCWFATTVDFNINELMPKTISKEYLCVLQNRLNLIQDTLQLKKRV